jgi:hypothetical protein
VALKERAGGLVAVAVSVGEPARRVARRLAVARSLRAARGRQYPRPIVLASVYRPESERTLAGLLNQVPAGTDVRLWALRHPVDRFGDRTVGSGPGTRWELLNRLLTHSPIPADAWVVVADDDVVFSKGGLADLLAVGDAGGFDLVQPAHSLASICTHQFVVARPLVRAGRVGFVEIGPLFAVAPSWRDRLLPFPEHLGMGWGTEVLWHDLHLQGMHMGVADAVRIVHCGQVAAGYSAAAADRVSERLLAEHGVPTMFDLMTRHGRWWVWQRDPPWDSGP